MFILKKQLSRLYAASIVNNLSLTGAWVAILASRGYSLVEIGITETVFHLVSLTFEIPSGVLADVFGRKKMLIVSTLMNMIASTLMIASTNLFMICISIAFIALSYNFASGSGDALAYDSMKLHHAENGFEAYESNQLIIYRLCSGISTLCAGFALTIGHKLAYSTDLVMGVIQLFILSRLSEVCAGSAHKQQPMGKRLLSCFRESFAYIREVRRAFGLMLCNSFVGAVDILLLFFLQAKLPQRGIPVWVLGIVLLIMEMGGIAGSKLILKCPHIRYRSLFILAVSLVTAGFVAEHSPMWWVMAAGGFIAAAADDTLQVRTNAILQSMFPSEQRATLTSVESFSFSMIMIVLSPLAGVVFTFW